MLQVLGLRRSGSGSDAYMEGLGPGDCAGSGNKRLPRKRDYGLCSVHAAAHEPRQLSTGLKGHRGLRGPLTETSSALPW